MKITRNISKISEEVVAIVCEICKHEYSDPFEIQEFTRIDYIGGYTSVFGDGHLVEADICQHCLKKKLGKFLRVSDTMLF